MKLNKWLSILMMSCSLLIGFTACDDDDDCDGLALSAPVLTEITAPTAIATSDVIVKQKIWMKVISESWLMDSATVLQRIQRLIAPQ